jgi:Ca2+/H+ antiporter, TMEM165/GDT1 family
MNAAVALPSFLASSVEMVEALTIVLALGVTRGWRSPILGAIAASLLLLAITASFGVTLTQLVPIAVLRSVVGILLLLFGLKWLRKAILRFTGLKAVHDEAQIYREEMELARAQARVAAGKLDWFGFVASFKSVGLEGLEVAFIVIALGAASAQPHAFVSAAAGAAAAGLLVIGAALVVAQPLARVPENHLKFVVGLMLTSFGTFWTAEGLGARWWHADASIVWLVAGYFVVSVLLIGGLRRIAAQRPSNLAPSRTAPVQP